MSILSNQLDKPPVPEETTSEEAIPEDISWSDKARLLGQGISLNYGDEAWAGIRSILSRAAGGELTYEEAVKEERDSLEKVRKNFPATSIAYEMGGALIPSLFSMAFSGGVSTPVVAANIARILGQTGKIMLKGAVEGGVAATGAGEGGIGERVLDVDTAIGTVAGATVSPLLSKTFQLGSKAIGKVVDRDFLRKMLGGVVTKNQEAEIIRVMESTELSLAEIFDRASRGETIPEMEPSVAVTLRALYSEGGKQGEVARQILERTRKKGEEAAAELQLGLTPDPLKETGFSSGNVLKYFNKAIEDLEIEEGKAYDKVFAGFDQTSNDLNVATLQVLQGQTKTRSKIEALIEAEELPDLFRVNPKTKAVELLRDVTLKEAEVIRRGLKGISTAAFKGDNPELGPPLSKIEKRLRSVIDSVSPELAETRAAWAAINRSSDAFQDGSKILTKSPDEVEVIFDKLLQGKDDNAISAFRAGYASALRARLSKNRTTLFNSLNDIDKKEQQILRTIYPEDELEFAMQKINLAARSANVKNTILGQSITAKQQAASKRIGTASGVGNFVEFVRSGGTNIFAGVRLLRDFVGEGMDNLSAEDKTTVVKTLISEDMDLLKKALNDETAYGQLRSRINQLVGAVSAGVRRGSATTTSEDIQQGDSRAVRSIINSVTPKTRAKILGTTQQ